MRPKATGSLLDPGDMGGELDKPMKEPGIRRDVGLAPGCAQPARRPGRLDAEVVLRFIEARR